MTIPKPITLDGEKLPIETSLNKPDYYDKERRRIYNSYYKEVILKKRKVHRKPFTPDIHQTICILDPLQDMETICSTFGCCTPLSLTEKLCGSKCLLCQGKQKPDPTIRVKLK